MTYFIPFQELTYTKARCYEGTFLGWFLTVGLWNLKCVMNSFQKASVELDKYLKRVFVTKGIFC